MITIREETINDIGFVHEINVLAFEQPDEANLVDKLRARCAEILSLVAIRDDKVAGHILFSPVTIESDDNRAVGMGLGPMAVSPEYQNQGIGSTLIRYGLDRLKDGGCEFVVVLGHSDYYPKFGFVPASEYNVRCKWDVPDEVFMIQVFHQSDLSGLACYQPEFSELT